jgi:hypothetical protein
MASKKRRQTFEKMKREQTIRERRQQKEERKAAARLAKAAEASKTADPAVTEPAGEIEDDGRSA